MYPVIVAPFPVAPLNSMLTLLLPGVPVMTVGAVGMPAGVATTPLEFVPLPTPFSAATVKVYAMPLVSPVNSETVEEVVIDNPPGWAVITYCVIDVPPSLVGGLNEIVAFVSPRTTSVIVGALGGPRGVTEFELPEAVDPPTALFATTVNEYVEPLVSPPTKQLVKFAAAVQVAPPGEAVTV